MRTRTRRPWRLIASIFATSVLCLVAESSLAAGINLSWDDCGTYGVANRTFACNANVATAGVAYVSFTPTYQSGFATTRTMVFDLAAASSTLPGWWQFAGGGCRSGALGVSGSFDMGPFNCSDMWTGVPATTSTAYSAGFGGIPNRARLVVTTQIAEVVALPTNYAEMEWYALRLTLSGAKTVGTNSCGGCATPVCLVLNSLRLDSIAPGDVPTVTLTSPLQRNWVTWQGGAVAGGCPAATPVRNRTWGMLKSSYAN